MSDDRYNLVFKGELVKSVALAQAKQNLSRLFKVTGSKLDLLFSGEPVVLKKNLDFDTATKYRVAIKKAGARVDLVLVAPANAEKTKPKPDSRSAPTTPPAHLEKAPGVTAGSVEAAVSNQVDYQIAESIALTPVGTTISEEEAREDLPLIDVSSMSLSDLGADLLKPNERESLPLVEVNTSHMSLAEAGEDLLLAEEKARRESLQLDLSGYSVAELGTTLGEPAQPLSSTPPDISRLKLIDE